MGCFMILKFDSDELCIAIPIKNEIIAVDNCVRVKILDGFKNQGKNAATEFDIISIDISFKAAQFFKT